MRGMRRRGTASIVKTPTKEDAMSVTPQPATPAADEHLGPIDIVVIGYPAGAPMTGDAAPLLLDLVERGTIRVLDALFVTKEADGTFSGFDASGLDDTHPGEWSVFAGASSGM